MVQSGVTAFLKLVGDFDKPFSLHFKISEKDTSVSYTLLAGERGFKKASLSLLRLALLSRALSAVSLLDWST